MQLTRQRGKQGVVNRHPRAATLTLRFDAVTLPPPANDPRPRTSASPALKLWAVYAREENPPPDVRPGQVIDWMLLSSEPVRSVDEALRAIGRYRKRRIIEEFHRALKEGCRLESTRLDHAEDIQRLAAVQSVVAVRLLQLRDAADEARAGDDPKVLRLLVPEIWRQVAGLWSGRDPDALTPKEFYEIVARRGGWLGRKHDGRPGWKTLHLGLRDLQIAADILHLARPPTCG